MKKQHKKNIKNKKKNTQIKCKNCKNWVEILDGGLNYQCKLGWKRIRKEGSDRSSITSTIYMRANDGQDCPDFDKVG